MEGYIRRAMLALAMEKVLPPESTYDPWGPPITDPEIRAIAAALERLKTTARDESSRSIEALPAAFAQGDPTSE